VAHFSADNNGVVGLDDDWALTSGAPCALVEDMNGTWKPSDTTVADPARNERRSSLGI
jgi:hypothetical protein